ncbi:MAG: hypothetical protein ACRDOD_17600, partial [Streptosporangiaceae bacterium]
VVGTSVRIRPADRDRPKLRYPRARIRPDAYGLAATVKTIPKVGRPEIEAVAEHIGNAWRCQRVAVSQPRPGRVLVRGFIRDPLDEPLTMADVPAAVYAGRRIPDLYLGRDEFGTHRFGSLANITAAVFGGQPGQGKTSQATSFLMQLAPSPAVQLAILDGQGGADFRAWQDRAFLYAGDDLADGVAALEDVHALMRSRYVAVRSGTGPRNLWRT